MRLADRKEALQALRKIGVTVGSDRWPTPQDVIRGSQEAQANILQRNRSDLVKRYRANPNAWPDGITHKNSSDQWYNPQDWSDDGKWIAPHKPPWLIIDAKPVAHTVGQQEINPDNIKVEKPSPEEVAAAIRTVLPRPEPPPEPVNIVNTLPVNTVTEIVNNPPPLTANSSLLTPPVNIPVSSPVNTPTDRKTYMREYMRQRRAALKATTVIQPSTA